jgi:hypothetical protein
VCFVAVEVVKLALAIAWVLKIKEIGARKGATCGTGVAVPFVVLLPAGRSQAPTALSCGGRGVVAASSAKVSKVLTFQASDIDLLIVSANLFHGL